MKIAVSACLLGTPCRYDGRSKPCEAVKALARDHEIVPVCPEVAGGLPIPHPANEIMHGEESLRVADAQGNDNTEAFVAGARATLERVLGASCEVAVLKAKSPSCGSGKIYDGTFSGTLVEGWGVAARMIDHAGVRVIDETQVEELENLADRS